MRQKVAGTTRLTRSVPATLLGTLLLLGHAGAQTAPKPPAPAEQPLTPYQTALLDYQNGHIEDARTAVEAAEKQQPGNQAVEILKARILTEAGDFAAGEKVLRPLLTPKGPLDVQMALGDLYLRKRSFSLAADTYAAALKNKADDPDITLKLIYAQINASDLVSAGKNASRLKPLDQINPAYYFATAALAQATGKSGEVEEQIQTARTLYGVTVCNRYLKTYLEVFATPAKAPTDPAPQKPAAPAKT